MPKKRKTHTDPDGRKSKAAVTASPFPIVAIGVAAGGRDALKVLFACIPPEPKLAFVVIQHPGRHSNVITAPQFTKYTTLDIREVKSGMKVRPDTVYLARPSRNLAVINGVFRLTEPVRGGSVRLPIDYFFRSLAADQGEKAVGIILSGVVGDGTLGLEAIKGSGGMVMVQDPRQARYDGMPRNAIDTGMADFVLPVEKMPRKLLHYIAQPYVKSTGNLSAAAKKYRTALQKIFRQVQVVTGHDFSGYKQNTTLRRILRRMAMGGFDTLEDYISILRKYPKEVRALDKDLYIRITGFFRDPEAFGVLKQALFRILRQRKPSDPVFRVWVPGCGSGQEAYSLAILLTEAAGELKKDIRFRIFGSDIDVQSIARARAAAYPASIAADVGRDRLKRFFIKDGLHYRVAPEIRDRVSFSVRNLIEDTPFYQTDFISCRNLFIYLEAGLQQRILAVFHESLRGPGFLLLGLSESTGMASRFFTPVNAAWKLFGRKAAEPATGSVSAHGPVTSEPSRPAAMKPRLRLPDKMTPAEVARLVKDLQVHQIELEMQNQELGQVQSGLEESEKKFRAFFEQTPECCYMVSADGTILDVNRAALKILGYAKNEMLGLPLSKMYAPGSRARAKVLFKKWRIHGKLNDEEIDIVTRQGEIRTVLLSANSIKNDDGSAGYSISVHKDITDKIKAEEAVKNMARFPAENPYPVFRVSGKGMVMFANPAAVPVLEHDGSGPGKKLPDRWKTPVAGALRTGKIRGMETGYREKRYYFSLVPVPEGRYVNVYGLDITDRKKAEEDVRRSENRFRLAQTAARIGYWDWDIRVDTLVWSKATENMFGFRKKTFRGTYGAFMECIHPEDRGTVEDSAAACLKSGQKFNIEHRIIRPDGSEGWMAQTGVVERDGRGRPHHVYGIVQDITERKNKELNFKQDSRERLEGESRERKKTEAVLSQRERVLESIYRITTDLKKNFTQKCDVICLEVANLLSVPIVVIQRKTHDRLATVSLNIRGRLSRGKDPPRHCGLCSIIYQKGENLQLHGNLKDKFRDVPCMERHGSQAYLGLPVKDSTGTVVGILCAMDSTPRTFAGNEVQLMEIFARYIAREIEHEEIELELALTRERDTLGQLTAGVAHEVRNPLNAIMSGAMVLKQELKDNRDLDGFVQDITDQVERLSKLMEDLLVLGKPLRTSSLRQLPICETVQEALALWRGSTALKDHHAVLDMHPDIIGLHISGDSTKLQQAILNLIENAAQHSPPRRKIACSVYRGGDNSVYIDIRDQGTGIPPENIGKIFEPFFTTRKGGFGLGTSIVRHLIALHGGRVSISNNEPGPGCTVKIVLPILERRTAGEHKQCKSPDHHRRRKGDNIPAGRSPGA